MPRGPGFNSPRLHKEKAKARESGLCFVKVKSERVKVKAES
jgi:hypothetical protein